MSEYQYYEFRTIDKPLSKKQMKEVGEMSSRVELTDRQAIFVYNYGDFRYREEKVLADYFDMAIYLANWGTFRLLMKIPESLVDFKTLQQYDVGREHEFSLQVKRKKGNVIIDFYLNHEDYDGGWMEGSGLLGEMIPLRQQIINDDLRVLYLAWLRVSSLYAGFEDFYEEDDFDDDNMKKEPRIPDNLHKLDSALNAFVSFWDIDVDLINAAALNSLKIEHTKESNLTSFISKLSKKEKDDFLIKVLEGDGQVQNKLIRRLKEFDETQKLENDHSPRTFGEISKLKEGVESKRLKKEFAAEKREHIKRMKKIGAQLTELWEETRENASKKLASGYNVATEILVDLYNYAQYSGTEKEFEKDLEQFRIEHPSIALKRRLIDKGVIKLR